jgi:hypothetical protein
MELKIPELIKGNIFLFAAKFCLMSKVIIVATFASNFNIVT